MRADVEIRQGDLQKKGQSISAVRQVDIEVADEICTYIASMREYRIQHALTGIHKIVRVSPNQLRVRILLEPHSNVRLC
jgi:hypothetical protein